MLEYHENYGLMQDAVITIMLFNNLCHLPVLRNEGVIEM